MADFHRKAPPPAMAYYGDVFGGPPKFSAAGSVPPSFPPQVDEYGEIFRGFSLRKGGGGGAIPFLDLPMLDEDEVSLSVSGFDYSEIFGGVGCGSFAMDLDQVLSQQRGDKDPSAINGTGSETGRPYPATMLTEECSKNCLSASDQFSSYESSQHVQDGIQQVNVSYNKSNYVTKGDPLNGTTHIAQLHEIPGFTVVVDSFSPHSKMASSGTTLNGGLSDLSSSAMEKDLAKQSRSQVSFSGDAQRVSRNNIVRTEDIKLDSTSTGGKESHAEESCSSHNSSGRLSSDRNENLKKLEAHPPASENIPACRQSLYSDAYVRSIGDESPACKAFLTVSDINLRTQPSVLPPPSRPPPKSGVKKMKENLSKACAASPPFLDVEIDVTSDAAASAAAMREAMAKAQAKLKSAKESMERRRDNNLNRLKFTLNEDHKGVATLERKIADKDRKSKEDEAEEAFVSRYSGPKFHGIGAHLRATTGDYEIAGFDEKFGHRRHNKIEESLANGYSKELGANNLDCNLGQKSVEWKAEKQFYELVNNGPNLEVGNEVSEGNNDQKLKVVIQSLDQESSSKAAKLDRLAVKNEKLRAFQGECDNRFKTSSDLEEVVGNKLSLSKDDGGNVNAIFFGENDMKVGEVKETNVQESEKNWRTFNKIEDKNKLKTVSDFEKRDKLRAIYGNDEMVEQKTARKHKEEDSRQIANYVSEEEEKRQIATQTWEHEQKHLRVTRECEEERNRLKEACELEEEKKAARDCEEEEKKLKTAPEREDAEKRLKMARDHEEEEKRLKMPRDREQVEKRLKMACQKQEEEKRLKMACQKQEEEKRLKVAREREEEEERLKRAREREEEEKRLKVAHEREEEEQRLKVAHAHEEEEKRLKMAREHEEEEKRLKVARECEEEEKRLKVAREREEEEKRLKVAREREEEEKRLKMAREREEEKRLEVAREHEEEEKRLKVAREREEEEKRLKVAHEHDEEEKRLKMAREHEEEEERLKLACKVEEEENRLRAAHELEEEENRLRAAPELEEGEKSVKAARQCGGEDKRMKVAHEREEEEKRLRAACEIENEEKNLKAARESEEERLKATCKCEEEENMKSDCHAEERLMRQEVHIHEVKIKVSEVFLKVEEIGNNWEKLKGDQNLQADEKIESDLLPENRAQVPKKCNKIQSKDKNENKVEPDQELNAENEIRVNMIDEVSVCATNGNNLTAVEKVYNGEQTVEKIETAYEANQNEKRFAGSLNNVVLKDVNGTNVMEPPLASVSEKNKKKLKKGQVKFDQEDGKQPKGSNVTREFLGEEKVAEKDYMASGREEINDSFSAAREASTTVENGGRSRDAEVDGVLNEKEKQLRTSQQKMSQDMNKEDTVASQNYEKKRKEKEEQLRRYRDLELERLKILEEEREREREREKDRIAVERATRDARERAFGEVRERAERAAVERATAEARQRALAEARERAEKASLSEKAGSEAARLRVERAAVERATAEARQRAAEKAMAAVKDRSNGGMGQNISSFEDRNLHVPVGESAQRCKARLERHQRTAERAAKALAEKNLRDVLAQREQVERNRLAENLGADIRRWSNGKEGNLRALLSTLQYILGPESGWQPVPLTEVITAAAVKKAYRKATLCVHPDKVQQRGASIQQKYICEKVFDLLKDAWNKFNSEER